MASVFHQGLQLPPAPTIHGLQAAGDRLHQAIALAAVSLGHRPHGENSSGGQPGVLGRGQEVEAFGRHLAVVHEAQAVLQTHHLLHERPCLAVVDLRDELEGIAKTLAADT